MEYISSSPAVVNLSLFIQIYRKMYLQIYDTILQGSDSWGACYKYRRESVRLSREKMWIRRAHTIHPHGLNTQEGNDQFPPFSPFFFLQRNVYIILFYIYFTFVLHLFRLLVYLSVLFYTPFWLSDCLLFTNLIISSSSQKLLVPLYRLFILKNRLLCGPQDH